MRPHITGRRSPRCSEQRRRSRPPTWVTRRAARQRQAPSHGRGCPRSRTRAREGGRRPTAEADDAGRPPWWTRASGPGCTRAARTGRGPRLGAWQGSGPSDHAASRTARQGHEARPRRRAEVEELTRRRARDRRSTPRPRWPRTSARSTSIFESAASPAWPQSWPVGSRSVARARSAAASSTPPLPMTRATSAAPTRRRLGRATSPRTSSGRHARSWSRRSSPSSRERARAARTGRPPTGKRAHEAAPRTLEQSTAAEADGTALDAQRRPRRRQARAAAASPSDAQLATRQPTGRVGHPARRRAHRAARRPPGAVDGDPAGPTADPLGQHPRGRSRRVAHPVPEPGPRPSESRGCPGARARGRIRLVADRARRRAPRRGAPRRHHRAGVRRAARAAAEAVLADETVSGPSRPART